MTPQLSREDHNTRAICEVCFQHLFNHVQTPAQDAALLALERVLDEFYGSSDWTAEAA